MKTVYHLRKLVSGAVIGRPASETYATMSENYLGKKTHIKHDGKIMKLPEKAYCYRWQKGRHGQPRHRLMYYLWQPVDNKSTGEKK